MTSAAARPSTPNPNIKATGVFLTRKSPLDPRSVPPGPRGGAVTTPASFLRPPLHQARAGRLAGRFRVGCSLPSQKSQVISRVRSPALALSQSTRCFHDGPFTISIQVRTSNTKHTHVIFYRQGAHSTHSGRCFAARNPGADAVAFPSLPAWLMRTQDRFVAPCAALSRFSLVDRSWTDVRGRSSRPACFSDLSGTRDSASEFP